MIKLECPNCDGRGSIPLPAHLQSVLTAVKLGSRIAADVHARLNEDVSVTAINHRLSDLLNLGLVTRKRSGKCWAYEPKK